MKLKVAYEMVYDALNHLFWKTGSCLYEEIREKDNGIRRYQVYISLSELEKIVERYKKEGELRVEHSISNKGTATSTNNDWNIRSTFH